MDRADLDRRFNYHPPRTVEIGKLHEIIRSEIKDVAEYIMVEIPKCREQSLALTKLEEAMMWANAAIAREMSAKGADE
ncbi:MAG: hypothetical protein GY906_36950 [bacterium]|nr:hypothetical protein [bacterium]